MTFLNPRRPLTPAAQGPYPIAAGVAADNKHLKLNHEQLPNRESPRKPVRGIPAYAGESL